MSEYLSDFLKISDLEESETHLLLMRFKRLLKQFGDPRVIVTDNAPYILATFTNLQKQGRCKNNDIKESSSLTI